VETVFDVLSQLRGFPWTALAALCFAESRSYGSCLSSFCCLIHARPTRIIIIINTRAMAVTLPTQLFKLIHNLLNLLMNQHYHVTFYEIVNTLL